MDELVSRSLGIEFTQSFFTNFREHPEYMGSAFSWNKFPELIEHFANNYFFIYFNNDINSEDNIENKEKFKNIFVESARKEAEQLIKYNFDY